MRLLLDTHLLLWALAAPEWLDRATRTLIEDPATEVLFSAASMCEIAVKAALGRADFIARPEIIAVAARETGFTELPIHATAAARVADLPSHHRDPFDRLLIAQAMQEPARFYTADPALTAYSELVVLVP